MQVGNVPLICAHCIACVRSRLYPPPSHSTSQPESVRVGGRHRTMSRLFIAVCSRQVWHHCFIHWVGAPWRCARHSSANAIVSIIAKVFAFCLQQMHAVCFCLLLTRASTLVSPWLRHQISRTSVWLFAAKHLDSSVIVFNHVHVMCQLAVASLIGTSVHFGVPRGCHARMHI